MSTEHHASSDTSMQAAGAASPPVNVAARSVDLVKTYGKSDAVVRALDGITVRVPRSQT